MYAVVQALSALRAMSVADKMEITMDLSVTLAVAITGLDSFNRTSGTPSARPSLPDNPAYKR